MDIRLRWLLLAFAAAVLVIHSLLYNFVTDDAYISFVYSRNFAEHGELTFNLGDHVEGYTNFLWTLVLGILMVPGIPPETSSRVLSTLCALATLFLAMRATDRALGRRTWWGALPPILLAWSSGFACWTSGGLETQLYTVLVTAALDALAGDKLNRAGVFLALASMTRPEGPMLAAVFGVAWYLPKLLDKRLPGREELVGAAWFLALWAPWFAWRWWYYGYPFPNTYYVKATGDWTDGKFPGEMHVNGAYYVWAWLWQTKLVIALPLLVVGLGAGVARKSRALVACAGMLVFYVPYAISVGGDFMGLHRFIMPLFVVCAIGVACGLEWVIGKTEANAKIAIGAAVVLAAAFAGSQILLTRRSLDPSNIDADRGVIDTPAYLIKYTEDRAAIGRAMAPCFKDDDVSIVGGAGAQPYFGRMRAYDVFGLVWEKVAHDEPRRRPRAGHTKFAADTLSLSMDPTFYFACYAIHTDPKKFRWSCGSPSFWLAHGYEQITMQIPDMREGDYYTFLAKKTRHFECPGRVR